MPDAVKEYLSPEWSAVAQCVDSYEGNCGSEFPDLRSFVSRLSPAERPIALAELVKIELERRWQTGEKKLVEEYLRDYPELGDPRVSLPDLVAQESIVRQKHGQPLTPEESRRRFPNLSDGGSPRQVDITGTVALSDPNVETRTSESQPSPRDASGTMPFDSRESAAAQSGISTARQTATGPSTGPSEKRQAAPVPRQAPAPFTGTIGRYTICDELGAGTFGVVYRCVDSELKRDVAVKLPHRGGASAADRAKEFLHEARSAARLRHPGIVTVLDTGETNDGRVYIVYEFIRGDTLQKRLDRGEYTLPQVVEWVAGSAEALHHAHKNGIVHRDIKPANILLDEEECPHIADFGLAKMDDHFFKDDTGRVLGTVAYMSPEQAAGQSHWATPHTDIYSLGVMLYQMLTKRLPFNAGSMTEVLEQVRLRVPPPPRTIDDKIPRDVEAVCLKAMAKNPADRYSTAADMAADLRASLGGTPPPRRASWLTIGAGGAAVAAVAALLIVAFNRNQDPTSQGISGITARQNGTQQGFPTDSGKDFAFEPGTPQLVISYQSPREKGVSHEWRPLDAAPLVVHEGDQLQFHVKLGTPRYVYLLWYDIAGKPTLLWPKDPSRQQAATQVDSPGPEDQWHVLDSQRGAECFLVAVRDQPLDAAALERFEQQAAYDQGDIRLDNTFSLGSKELSRGLAGIVKSRKNPFAPQFEKTLGETFASYQGAVIPHR